MIHALPGTGADHRMFPEPWGSLPGFKAQDWITSPDIRTVRQLAEAMVEARGIADGDVLVGASLGGMVAAEITKFRKISRLFLVGSAVNKEEVNPWLAKLHPLADKVPMAWLKRSAGKLPGDAAAMLADADPDFVRRMILAIFQWEGLGKTQTQVFRIHGRKDKVISVPKDCDLLLGGGHLIAMTHAVECARFVERQLKSPLP
jgi:pimeloyl-ACP methyl ester carboxylesterase